jgi:hypothetical protein
MNGQNGALEIGTSVRVLVPSDHPEDPVGTVVMFLNDDAAGGKGGVVVQFPLAGAEVHNRSHLEIVTAEEPA